MFLTVADLQVFKADIDEVKAQAMINDAEALAATVAPCILSEGFAWQDAVRAILRRAVLRWDDTGSGALQSATVGPFSQTFDSRQPQRGIFQATEVAQLQSLCAGSGGSSYSLSLAGS